MKTKVVKSILSVGLIFSMVLSLFSGLTVSAEDAVPTVEYLFYEDFENDEAENAPTTFYDGAANNKYTDETKTAANVSNVVVKNDSTHGNYAEIITSTTDKSAKQAKIFFSKAVSKKDGTVVFEFDGHINCQDTASGTDTRKNVYTSIVTEDRATINRTQNVLTNRGRDRGPENLHGFSVTKYTGENIANSIYSGTTETTALYAYNDSASLMLRNNNEWNHYKTEINLADGTQQLWVNGKISEIWRDKEFYTKVAKGNESLDALLFGAGTHSTEYASPSNWLIDNIKVYLKDTADTSPFSGGITQDTKTGVVTANFTSAMKSDGIALYDADGNNVTKSVSLTADGKTATITPKSSTKGLYYVKVGTYAGGTVPAQTEKTVELNWEKDPTSYLFYEDFEGQTENNAPTNFYKDDATHKYTYTDATKEAVSTDCAVISKDTTHGNYLELVPTYPVQRAKVFLNEAVDRSDGTIVIEYDGLINIEGGDGNNGRKFIYATITGQKKDRATIKTPASELLNNKGSDVGNALAFKEMVYIADGTADNRYNGTYDGRKKADGTYARNDRMLYYYNDPIKNENSNEGNAIKRTNNTWQHYKMELNLATGTQQLWIDGKASEIWCDKNLYANIKWEGFSMDAISFQNYADGVKSYTNWLIDNIKVYKKDTADTSPFETITSEKNGDVTVKFGYAVNAADLSVYNADGEKINGKFVMSEDNKTATFTPDRIEDDGLYYVKVAKLASGTVTTQTTKEFTYAPGRTKMVISGLNTVVGTIAPTFTLTHTDGAAKEVVMIVAAYKGGKLVKANVETESLTTEDKTGAVATVPTIVLADGDADTVKAFAWIGGTNVPICNAGVYTTINN